MAETIDGRRKKLLKRQYQETARKMGICRIFNKASGKSLVESSCDVEARLNRHLAEVRMGTHLNRALQNDWNKFGAETFVFECVDILEPPDDPDYNPEDDLGELLALWLEKLSPFGDRGYNGA